MQLFKVAYVIEVDAETVGEAAQIAQRFCLDPTFETRYWTVTLESGDTVSVELRADGLIVWGGQSTPADR